ncbi:MAG: phospholipid carrier-dependent glycosyltransferase, partial [Candidatus Omnitrophota bacterium]
LKSLAAMNPKKFDFNPRQFSIGGAYLYPMGALFFLLNRIGLLHLNSDLSYYFFHPEEFAKFYITGRIVTVACGIGIIWLTYLLTLRLWKKRSAGFLAGILTAFSPLVILNSHYMYVDVPGLFWITLTVYLGVKYLQQQNRPSRSVPFLMGATSGLAFGSKLPFLPILAVPILTFILIREMPNRKKIENILISIATFSLIFFATNPYFFASGSEPVIDIAKNKSTYSFQGIVYLKSLGFGLGLPLLIFSSLGFLFSLKKEKNESCIHDKTLVIAWIIIFYLFISQFALHFGRYILPVVPVLIAVSVGFWLKPSRIRILNFIKTASVIFVVSTTFLYGMAYLSLFWKENTRTLAGEWIKKNIPAGATIGVTEIPWQYQMAPLDEDRYQLKVTGYDLKRLEETQPDYFILSSFQASIPPITKQMPPERSLFWDEFKESKKYQPLTFFHQPLTFWGITFSQNNASEDFIYLNPTIMIFQKN